jgi:lipopolysaccharide transport system ATP-binding protein
VQNEAGKTIDSLDIRQPVAIEMTFEVLEEGHILVPVLHFFNETGVCIFASIDLDPEWRGRPRSRGRFTSVAWIPGNFLSEGAVLVSSGVATHHPAAQVHFYQRDAVAFHVEDPCEGDSVRGDFDGTFPGLVRPLLKWSNTGPSPTAPLP